MPKQEKLEVLRKCIDEQIAGFNERRQANRKKAFAYRLVAVICGALTTVLIGVHSVVEQYRPIVNDCALALSAVVTALAAIEVFYNHRSLWIRYTVAYSQLRALSAKLDYTTAGGLDGVEETAIDHLFDEFQQILSETNANWLQLRKVTEPRHEG